MLTVESVLDLTKAQIDQIQQLLDTFIMYNSYFGPGPKKKAWIKTTILHGPNTLVVLVALESMILYTA